MDLRKLSFFLTLHGPRTGRDEVSVSGVSVHWSPHQSWAAPSCRGRHPLLTSSYPVDPSVAARIEGGGPETLIVNLTLFTLFLNIEMMLVFQNCCFIEDCFLYVELRKDCQV